MRRPADAGRAGYHAEHESTPHQRDNQAEENASEAACVPTAQHQKSQVTEDHSAGANVHRARRADEPRHEPGPKHPSQSDRNEVSLIPKHHHPTEDHKRDAVGGDVTETGVQKWSEQNAPQPNRRARDHAQCEERSTEEPIHHEHRPKQSERPAQNHRLRFECATYAGHARARSINLVRHKPI